MDVGLCYALKGRQQTTRKQIQQTRKLEGIAGLLHNICNTCQQQFERKSSTYQDCGSRRKSWREPERYQYYFHLLLLAAYCEKKMTHKKNWQGCKEKYKGIRNIHKIKSSQRCKSQQLLDPKQQDRSQKKFQSNGFHKGLSV